MSTPDNSQIVQYLSDLLDRARRGEVQVLIASAGCYDPKAQKFDIKVGIGVLEGVQSLPPEERKKALAVVMRGVALASQEVEKNLLTPTPSLLV